MGVGVDTLLDAVVDTPPPSNLGREIDGPPPPLLLLGSPAATKLGTLLGDSASADDEDSLLTVGALVDTLPNSGRLATEAGTPLDTGVTRMLLNEGSLEEIADVLVMVLF